MIVKEIERGKENVKEREKGKESVKEREKERENVKEIEIMIKVIKIKIDLKNHKSMIEISKKILKTIFLVVVEVEIN